MTPTVTHQRRAHYDAYVAYVHTLCASNPIRAALRQGRGRPLSECIPLHPYLRCRVAGHGGKRTHYTVASMIAMQRPAPSLGRLPGIDDTAPQSLLPDQTAAPTEQPWHWRPNLGVTLAQAVRTHRLNHGRTEERLHLLVRLSENQLHPRLPSLAEHLLGVHATPDWAVLLSDLAWWDNNRQEVGSRWVEAFYLTLESLPVHEFQEP